MEDTSLGTAQGCAAPMTLHGPLASNGRAAHADDHASPSWDQPRPGRSRLRHPLEWVDLVRIGLVAVAVVASWLGLWSGSVWGFRQFRRDRSGGDAGGRLPDLQGSGRQPRRPPDDDGTLHDHRPGCGPGHWRVLHRPGNRPLRPRRRGAGGADRGPGPAGHQRPAGPAAPQAPSSGVGAARRRSSAAEITGGRRGGGEARRSCSRWTAWWSPGTPSWTRPPSPASRCRSRSCRARRSTPGPSTSPACSRSAPTGIGRDTAFGKIIEAVERAEQSRAPIQKTADRLAGYLVYFAIGCAVLTFLVTRDVRSTISVVIVAGACGIAAGTPAGHPGGHWPGRPPGGDHQGRPLPGGAGHGRHHRSRQDRHADPRQPRSGRRASLSRRDAGSRRGSRGHCGAAFRASPRQSRSCEKAAEMSLAVTEPERFEYVPGKGIACSLDGEQIVVGSRASSNSKRIDLPQSWPPLPPLVRSAGGPRRTPAGVAAHRGRLATRGGAGGRRLAEDGAADGAPHRRRRGHRPGGRQTVGARRGRGRTAARREGGPRSRR